MRRLGLAFIRSSLPQLKLHCPRITIEDVRKSDLLAELTDVMSDGASQDLWLLSVGIDNTPWGQYQHLILFFCVCRETINSHRDILIPLFNNMHHCDRTYAILKQDTVTFHTANNSTSSLEKVFGDRIGRGTVTSMFVSSEPV